MISLWRRCAGFFTILTGLKKSSYNTGLYSESLRSSFSSAILSSNECIGAVSFSSSIDSTSSSSDYITRGRFFLIKVDFFDEDILLEGILLSSIVTEPNEASIWARL